MRELEENRGLRVDELKNNDQFISTLMQATQMAIRTHQEEKKAALRNAVLNAALPQSIEDARQQMFLAFVDSFTEWHLRILRLFQKPPELTGVMMGGLDMVIERGFPELHGKEIFYDQVWKDLRARGLVTTDSIHGTMSGAGLAAKRTSEFGDEFLRFVSAP